MKGKVLLKAKDYYDIGSRQESAQCLFMLGLIYEKGYGVKRNFMIAKDYYELSYKYGNYSSLFKLGTLFITGEGFDIDYTKAIKYFKSCLETKGEKLPIEKNGYHYLFFNNKYYSSNNELGLIYHLFIKNDQLSHKYFKESVSGEYPPGQNNYGLLY